ncbi:MAG: hypothetical protein ACOVNY_05555, partial [Chitinophagaceae bacterium]
MQTIIILIFLIFLNKFLYKSFLNPILVHSLLWCSYYFILVLNIDFFLVEINQLNRYVLYQSLGFSIGGFICFLFTKNVSTVQKNKTGVSVLERATYNVKLIFPYVFIILLISIVGVVIISGSFSISKIADLRATLTEDDGKKYGLLGLMQSLLSVYLIVTLAVLRKLSLKYIFFILGFIYFSL